MMLSVEVYALLASLFLYTPVAVGLCNHQIFGSYIAPKLGTVRIRDNVVSIESHWSFKATG